MEPVKLTSGAVSRTIRDPYVVGLLARGVLDMLRIPSEQGPNLGEWLRRAGKKTLPEASGKFSDVSGMAALKAVTDALRAVDEKDATAKQQLHGAADLLAAFVVAFSRSHPAKKQILALLHRLGTTLEKILEWPSERWAETRVADRIVRKLAGHV